MTPPTEPSPDLAPDFTPGASDAGARAAAEAERQAPPIPSSGSAPYPPLRGPYPPAPYPPHPTGPTGAAPAGIEPYLRGGRERQRVSPAVVVVGSLLALLALLMCVGLVFAGALQGMAWAAGPAQATESQSFTVSGTPTLSLDLSAVNVQIVPGQSGQVTMTLTKQAQAVTRAAARQALAATQLNATQDGDTISVHVAPMAFDGFPGVTKWNLELTVYVPAATNLNLALGATNLHASGLSGTLVGQVSASNLTLEGMTVAGASSLRVSAGNVEYHGALAPSASLDVDETAGNVHLWLPRATRTHVQASVAGGNASVTGWPTAAAGATRSGNGSVSVDLNPQPTSTLTVEVTGGNVTVEPGA